MGMASGNESKINTTLFLNTADQLGAVSKSLQGQFQEWQQAMNSLRGQWQGEGSDQVRNAAMQIKKSLEELLKNLKIVWERKAKVILITRFPKSPGASYAHVVLQCGSKEGPLQVGSVAARVAQLYLTDVLFHEVCRRHPDQCAAIRQVVAEALSDKHI